MKTHLSVVFLLSSLLGLAQTRLCGLVTDLKKRPLSGANITLKNTYDGASSDSAGRFCMITAETGRQVLVISHLGFLEQELSLNLDSSLLNNYEINLKENPAQLIPVVITGGSFEAGDQKKSAVLSSLDIVTTASANADIATAMKTLPGSQQVGESAELFVRGGEGYETKQFIDGMVVPNPFAGQLPGLAGRGRFSPFLFKGTTFSSGGYSALYGQALSSAILLESITLPERSDVSLSISPIFIGGQVQKLNEKKTNSWGLSTSVSDLSAYMAAVRQKPDFFIKPKGFETDANLRLKTGKEGFLKVYLKFDQNKLGVRNPDIDLPEYKNAFSSNSQNFYSNLSLRERMGNRLKNTTGMSFNYNRNQLTSSILNQYNQPVTALLPPWVAAKNFEGTVAQNFWQVRTLFDYKLKGLSSLKAGAEYHFSKDENLFGQYVSSLTENYGALFGESDVYLGPKLAARMGFRFEHSNLIKGHQLAPRLSLAWKMNTQSQITGDYGIFYQRPALSFFTGGNQLPPLRADHYIVTYQFTRASKILRTQVFVKDYKALVKTVPDTSTSGHGIASGIEFFWRDKTTIKNLDYWITYSFLNTKRNYLQFPYALTPNFAARHTVNVVAKRFISKISTQINMNYVFASGRPYYYFRYNAASQKFDLGEQGHTPNLHTLSLSINYLTKVAKSFAVIVASVNNVLNSNQVYNYNFNYDGSRKWAVNPPAKQFFFLGAFFTWGTDRRQDAINNNL